jgi:hypothetical protein
MGREDPIPGWGQAFIGPASGRRASIPQRLSQTWQIYRTNWRVIMALTVPIQGVLGLVLLPGYASALRVFQDVLGGNLLVTGDQDSVDRFTNNYLPTGPALAVQAAGPVVVLAVVILLTVAFALLLDSNDADGGLVRPRLSTVLARSRAFVVPLAVTVLGGIAFVLLEAAYIRQALSLDSSSVTSAGTGDQVLLALVIDVVIFGSLIAFAYAVARWILAIPVAAVERVGLLAALHRSTDLSRGNRVQVLLSVTVPTFLVGLVVPLLPLAGLALTGALFGSGSALALVTGAVLALAALILTAPFGPIMIVVLYRELRGGSYTPASPGHPDEGREA